MFASCCLDDVNAEVINIQNATYECHSLETAAALARGELVGCSDAGLMEDGVDIRTLSPLHRVSPAAAMFFKVFASAVRGSIEYEFVEDGSVQRNGYWVKEAFFAEAAVAAYTGSSPQPLGLLAARAARPVLFETWPDWLPARS